MKKTKPFREILKNCCSWSFQNAPRNILILIFLCAFQLYGQSSAVTGIVTEENGNPLPGVNVTIKGLVTGTITNTDGFYSLDVAGPDAVLVISYIGMLTHEILVGNQTVINVTLKADLMRLEEVVSVGYGTRRKSDLTGAISSVSAAEISSRPTPDVGAALQGKASGVLVKTGLSAPGSQAIIQIRGVNSVNSSYSPLYVVDGLPLSNIDGIDPMDIESLEVLKDASSTAIYGSRGANGVILITTKKGKSGKPVISYNTRFTIDKFVKKVDVMNAEQFVKVHNEWERQANPNITDETLWFNGSQFYRPTLATAGEGTDWFDVMTQTGHSQNHQLSISGGTDRSTYSTSINYYSHEGVMLGSKYSRGGFRTSNSYKVTDWLTTGFDVFANRAVHDNPLANINTKIDNVASSIFTVYTHGPVDPIYKPDGTYAINTIPGAGGRDATNPYCLAKENTNLDRTQRLLGNYYMNFEPIKDLNIKISAGGNADDGRLTTYEPTTTFNGDIAGGIARIANSSTRYWISENIVSYKKDVGKHRFDVMGGFTYEQNVDVYTDVISAGFVSDVTLFNNLGGANSPGIAQSSKFKWQLASLLARANYIYNEKYLLTVIARRDGSSKFGEDNKWGFFPSVSGAWRISEEDFLRDNAVISYMKLRAGYGQVGNSNIGLYQSLAVYGTDNYTFGGRVVPGVSLGGDRAWNTPVSEFMNPLDNPDLKWETTTSTNIGLDVSLYRRINLTLDVYYKKTDDLLMDINLVGTTGFQTAMMNVGKLDNKGIEFSADVRVVDRRDLKWNVSGFISANRNEIVELNGDPSSVWRIGESIGVSRGQINYGGKYGNVILETQADMDDYLRPDGTPMAIGAKLGDYRTKDINGDQIIDGDDRDITFDPHPEFIYAINTDLTYKNFMLSIHSYGSYGHDVYNVVAASLTQTTTITKNMLADLVDNYWTPDRPTGNKYRRLSGGGAGGSNVEDASFFRIQNVMLSYNIPVQKVFDNVRVYVSGQNLLTITKFTGYDPDVSSNGSFNVGGGGGGQLQQYGFDYGAYPTPVSVTFGLEVTFK